MQKAKIIYTLLLLAMVSTMAHAQSENQWTENILKVKYGWNAIVDPYLSPLRYTGQEIGIGNEWWKTLPDNWISVARIDVCGQRAYSAAKTNIYYGLGAQGSWGALYTWKIEQDNWHTMRGVDFLLGPELALDFMARQHVSNVNKPYSFDLGIDLNAAAGAAVRFGGKKTAYRVRYMIRTNLIGTDWTPEYWQSMYEVGTGQWKKNIRCSGPWNRNIVRQELTMDFQFVHSTWRLGAEHEWMTYRTHNMDWIRQEVRLVVGCVWKYRVDGRGIKE